MGRPRSREWFLRGWCAYLRGVTNQPADSGTGYRIGWTAAEHEFEGDCYRGRVPKSARDLGLQRADDWAAQWVGS